MKKFVTALLLCGILGAQPGKAGISEVSLPAWDHVAWFFALSIAKSTCSHLQKGKGTWLSTVLWGLPIDAISAIALKEVASSISGAVSKKPKSEDCWKRNDELQLENKALRDSVNTVTRNEHFHMILDAKMQLVSEKLKQRSRVFDNSQIEEDAARILADLLLYVGKLYSGAIQSEFYDSGKIIEAAKRYGLNTLLNESFMSTLVRVLGKFSEFAENRDYFMRLVKIIKSTSDSDF